MIVKTTRGAVYEVDEGLLNTLVAAFDLWRDGLGKFTGALGRAAFLRGTSDITRRFIPTDRFDPWKVERYTRALRTVLAERPREARPILVVAS